MNLTMQKSQFKIVFDNAAALSCFKSAKFHFLHHEHGSKYTTHVIFGRVLCFLFFHKFTRGSCLDGVWCGTRSEHRSGSWIQPG